MTKRYHVLDAVSILQELRNLTSTTVTIQRSSPDGDSCEESVVNQMGSMVTVMDTLRCRYAGRRVTYCLQSRTYECQSNVTTETVNSKNMYCYLPIIIH